MRKTLVSTTLLVLLLALLGPAPAGAASKEIIQLQRDVALLQQQVRDLQTSVDKNHAVLRTLVEQSLDAVSRMNTTVGELQTSVQQAQANTNTRVDALATQVQSLRDSVDELTARLGQMSQQLAETQSVLQSVDARLAPSAPEGTEGEPGSTTTPPGTSPPSAKTLYDNALRDFTGGKYELARQQFGDYLNYYGRTPLAGNAQFYIGETYYQQKDFRRAVAEYDKAIKNYPGGNKVAAAHLKKGYALLELNEREAGVKALRTVVDKFPRSQEAGLARSRLERLGERISP